MMENLIERYSKLPTGNVCDSNGRGGNMCAAIKPISRVMKMAGRAFTVKAQPGDNLGLHQALNAAPAGSILVIDVHGFTNAGAFGDIMATACIAKGIAGVVIDGACRDANDIEEMGLPVFCRGLNPGGTVKESLGELNKVIQCGGVVVKPGDIIVGDCDGVVVVSAELAEAVLEKAEAKNEKEKEIRRQLLEGKTTIELLGLGSKLGQE